VTAGLSTTYTSSDLTWPQADIQWIPFCNSKHFQNINL
jgi:hypothetical protein